MTMTTSEMIDFFRERIQGTRRGMDVAKSNGNYPLAALNCRQAFKYRLMKSLIEWRLGTNPSDSLTEVVEGFNVDWAKVSAISIGGAKSSDVPVERIAFVAYLVDKPCSIELSGDGLKSDRLLDLVLGKWLLDSWNSKLWQQGMEQLHQDGSDLAVQTYELYKAIVEAAASDLSALSQEGERLFARRKSDSFFSGGDQTEGGGEDNNVTVDYRLASLLKRAGYNETSKLHGWKW